MHLSQRFKRLTFWNKLGAIAGAASIVGIPLALILHFLPYTPSSDLTIRPSTEKAQPLNTSTPALQQSTPSASQSERSSDRESQDKGPAKTSPPQVTVNAPGGVVSVGQQGGITAKEVTINTTAPARVLASEQRQMASNDPQAPWATVFTITSTGLVATGDLRLKCTGPVIRAGIERINPYRLITGRNGPDPEDTTIVVYKLGPETLSPGRRVSVAVYSKDPVTVISGSIGENEILFHSQGSSSSPKE